MRLFIAIELSEPIRDYLSSIQEQFKGYGKLRFPQKENIHLTLKFLGDTDVSQVQDALSQITYTSFNLRLDKLGVFDSERYVRVLWAAYEAKKELLALKQDIDKALPGFKNDYSYKPHLTLARVNHLIDKDGFLQKLYTINVEPIKMKVDSFTLMNSTLGPEGPKYEVLARYNAIEKL